MRPGSPGRPSITIPTGKKARATSAWVIRCIVIWLALGLQLAQRLQLLATGDLWIQAGNSRKAAEALQGPPLPDMQGQEMPGRFDLSLDLTASLTGRPIHFDHG